MIRILQVLFLGLVTSFFLFPFNLPLTGMAINTKMVVAVVGAALLIIDRIRKDGPAVSRDFFILSIICIIVSVWAFGVAVWNNTNDYAFAGYVVSVWVWFGAAYCVVWLIRAVHGLVTVELIGNYLAAVSVAQCILAYLMVIWPPLGGFVNSLMGEGQAFMGAVDNRMYGLGAALDPAGLRFSGVLVILAYLTAKVDFSAEPVKGILYLLSFLIIAIIGNMIARSTTVGMLLSIPLFIGMKWSKGSPGVFDRSWAFIGGGLLLTTILAAVFYRINPAFHDNLRFGFEGFFSLIEKGRWETNSTEILRGMIVWPESLRTWLIGDGYFANPVDKPDIFGQVSSGFYMKTDIGYLRYIFYFGIIGLLGLAGVFVQMTTTCIRRLPGHSILFVMLLVMNMIGWGKVSSDIIMVFAPFVVLAYLSENDAE